MGHKYWFSIITSFINGFGRHPLLGAVLIILKALCCMAVRTLKLWTAIRHHFQVATHGWFSEASPAGIPPPPALFIGLHYLLFPIIVFMIFKFKNTFVIRLYTQYYALSMSIQTW